MPVYNCELYIQEAVESILAQTYTDFELLLIDDASKDKTVEIIKSFNDNRINLIQKPKNLGYTDSLNYGFSVAEGEYIARMDGDDFSLPTRFEKQVAYLDKHPDVVLCGANYSIIGTDIVNKLPENNDEIQIQFIRNNSIAHPVVMLRNSVLKANGIVYDVTKEPAEDFDLWVRLLNYGKLHNIQEVLLNYRVHQKQVSNLQSKKQRNISIDTKLNVFKNLSINWNQEEEKVLRKHLANIFFIDLKELETLKKIERYKEAAVGSAEERQKIAYFIQHEIGGTGESPLAGQMMRAFDANRGSGDSLPVDEEGKALAQDIAATANKQTYNMPVGAQLKQLESRNELFFTEFYETNANIQCAAIGIPPNVAFSLYNDSFSASRAATKDWEHTIEVERDFFNSQFYATIYSFWLYTEILKGDIQAPGYLRAIASDNYMVTEAYHNARFTGPMFPHINPLVEVQSERMKLGDLAANIPLTTVEAATEVLNGGDSDSNAAQFSEELKQAKQLGILNEEPKQVA